MPPWHLPGFWGSKGNLPEAKLTKQSRNPNTPPHTHNHNAVGSKIFPPFRRSRFRCDIFVFRKISFSMAMALLCSHTMRKMISHHPPHRARARRKFNPLKRVKSCVCVCEVHVALNVCTSEAILDRLAAESCLTTLNCVPFAGMPFCQGAVVWSYPPTKIGLSSLCRRRVVRHVLKNYRRFYQFRLSFREKTVGVELSHHVGIDNVDGKQHPPASTG